MRNEIKKENEILALKLRSLRLNTRLMEVMSANRYRKIFEL
jgi:hypothetical protein